MPVGKKNEMRLYLRYITQSKKRRIYIDQPAQLTLQDLCAVFRSTWKLPRHLAFYSAAEKGFLDPDAPMARLRLCDDDEVILVPVFP